MCVCVIKRAYPYAFVSAPGSYKTGGHKSFITNINIIKSKRKISREDEPHIKHPCRDGKDVTTNPLRCCPSGKVYPLNTTFSHPTTASYSQEKWGILLHYI